MNGYRRQYRSTPRPEAIRGADMVKCLAATSVAAFAALAMSMVLAMYQMADVARQQDEVIRDVLDGRIDNPQGFAAYTETAKRLHAALGTMLAQAEMKGG